MAATNDYVDISKGKLTFGLYAAENFRNLIEQQPLALAMKNSFIYAISVTIICLFICSLAGYGFEVYHDKWKDRLFSILLLGMMIPQVATMIPLFQMFSKGHLLNTVPGFFLPIISPRFGKWYLMLILSFLLTLSIETIQLVFKVGSFDVDDMFLNTLGGIAGYLCQWITRAIGRCLHGTSNR